MQHHHQRRRQSVALLAKRDTPLPICVTSCCCGRRLARPRTSAEDPASAIYRNPIVVRVHRRHRRASLQVECQARRLLVPCGCARRNRKRLANILFCCSFVCRPIRRARAERECQCLVVVAAEGPEGDYYCCSSRVHFKATARAGCVCVHVGAHLREGGQTACVIQAPLRGSQSVG